MLLTLTTTHRPATDLGFLLEKHPAKHQTYPLAFGEAHVFYPEASDTRCTAALLLELDPIGLARRLNRARALEAYVNDRPYVASSYFSVAIAQVLGSALAGRSPPSPFRSKRACPPCAVAVAKTWSDASSHRSATPSSSNRTRSIPRSPSGA